MRWRERGWRRVVRRGLAAASLGVAAAIGIGASPVAPGLNPYSDALMRMTPQAQAAKLATYLGETCIGTKPFLMGVTKEGHAKGYAYWSIECAGAGSYMIQIDPAGAGAAIDCKLLKEGGQGRECYKNF